MRPRTGRRRNMAPPQALAVGYSTLAFDDEFGVNAISYVNTGGGAYVPAPGGPSQPLWYSSANSGSVSTTNVFVSNGACVFVNPPNADGANAQITTNLDSYASTANNSTPGAIAVNTGAGVIFTYGYFEASISFPNSGNGGWPSFWLDSAFSSGTPTTTTHAELDILEYQSNTLTSTVWQWGPGPAGNSYNNAQAAGVANTNVITPPGYSPSLYNTYGCLWTPTSISFYIDNMLLSYASSSLVNPITLPGNFPAFVAPFATGVQGMTLAMGCGTSGMSVLWVRVWQ